MKNVGFDEFLNNISRLEAAVKEGSTVACTGDCSSTSCAGSRACD